jgi:hypothetical protein
MADERPPDKPEAHPKEPDLDCCPDLQPDAACDVLDFEYRLTHKVAVAERERPMQVPVEVIVKARLERCPGPLTRGDLVYTTTLLPGERVRLFTSDRRSHFVYDSATRVAYRNQHASEERAFMASMSHDLSNFSSTEKGTNQSASHPSSGGGGLLGALVTVATGGLVNLGGSHDGASTAEFTRSLSQHAESSHHRAEVLTRASSSISIGEVQTRAHTETESEDHFESSSREFSNANRCHAVTYFFYQVNKTQTVTFRILSVTRRVKDPVRLTTIDRALVGLGATAVIPHLVLSTDKERLEQESVDRRSSIQASTAGLMHQMVVGGSLTEDQVERVKRAAGGETAGSGQKPIVATDMSDIAAFAQVVGAAGASALGSHPVPAVEMEPFPTSVRDRALDEVAEDLIKSGILDPDRFTVAEGFRREMSFEKRSSLPTGGVIVKGCLDECDVCEPQQGRLIELELERKALENALLRKQIDLLDKSQEYRCCPEPEEAPA